MKYICMLLVLMVLAGAAAAAEDGKAGNGGAKGPAGTAPAATTPAAATPAGPTGWSADGLRVAEQLAAKVRAGGMACEGFEPATFAMFDADYQRRLPLAAAIASCSGDEDEDITFEVFADTKHAQEFITRKQAFLCKRAEQEEIADFPGFPYVEGGAWIVEPNQKETADKLAPILGGKAKMTPCAKK